MKRRRKGTAQAATATATATAVVGGAGVDAMRRDVVEAAESSEAKRSGVFKGPQQSKAKKRRAGRRNSNEEAHASTVAEKKAAVSEVADAKGPFEERGTVEKVPVKKTATGKRAGDRTGSRPAVAKKAKSTEERVVKEEAAEQQPASQKNGASGMAGGADNAAAVVGKDDFVPRAGHYKFDPCPYDHCETDIRAYRHLKPVLLKLEQALHGKNAGELRVWDPYYCDGAMKRHLSSLGFPKVHHENEDFYEVLKGRLPQHDVLVTSPPYSQDHIERCVQHCAASTKPWCALLPNWVFSKDFYQELLRTSLSENPPVYLGPVGQPYQYWFPPGALRPAHVQADGATTPYKTSWYICLPAHIGGDRLLQDLKKKGADWVVAKTVRGLKWLARKTEARGVNKAKAKRGAKPQQTRKGSGGAVEKPVTTNAARGPSPKEKRKEKRQEKRPPKKLLEVVPQRTVANAFALP